MLSHILGFLNQWLFTSGLFYFYVHIWISTFKRIRIRIAYLFIQFNLLYCCRQLFHLLIPLSQSSDSPCGVKVICWHFDPGNIDRGQTWLMDGQWLESIMPVLVGIRRCDHRHSRTLPYGPYIKITEGGLKSEEKWRGRTRCVRLKCIISYILADFNLFW